MKILMISRDINVLDKNSSVYKRMQRYASFFDELHVVVMAVTTKKMVPINSQGLYIYDTTSRFALLSFSKTLLVALRVAFKFHRTKSWVTSQDPFESGIIAFIVSKFTGLRLQLQLHTDCFNHFYRWHSISNFIRFVFAKLLIPQSYRLRVVSDTIKKDIVRLGLKKSSGIDVLPLYTDVESIVHTSTKASLREMFPEFNKIILMVCRLESEKNINLALRSFEKLLKVVPGAGLVIAGSGSKEPWLKKYAEHLSIAPYVKFLGWQSDVVSLYKSADALLITSFYEGFGLTMVEAVACGLPVVSVDVGVAHEVGASITSYDPGDISSNLIRVLSEEKKTILPSRFVLSPEKYDQKFIQTFNW